MHLPAAEHGASRTVDQLRPGDRVVVCGAGPAGLTAAYLLAHRGYDVTVLESSEAMGGISQTAQYRGYRFDIGGHRFFTKIRRVEELWEELLGEDLIDVPRLSRIHYEGKYFDYPLKAANALRGLGLARAASIIASYFRARLHPHPVEENFEQWVSNRFGRRLYETFFKTYTEKVWGVPCTEIRAEWAAQRIQGLSLARAVVSSAGLNRRSTDIRTLIHSFRYPRLGPGQMWERCRDRVVEMGGRVLTRHQVTAIEMRDGRAVAVRATTPGGERRFEAEHVVTTMPLRDLVRSFDPPPPAEVLAAGEGLGYRDFVVVALILDAEDLFPDNWIYIHTPGVRVGRIQNFNNWSAAMVPEPGRTCLGLEYFCFEGDGLWTSADEELIALATRELDELGLAPGARVVDGAVVRMPKAYPIYDSGYRDHLDVIRGHIDPIPNLHTVGRNGMHKYNNQDHSMLTAMLAVDNMHGAAHDLWAVNTDFEYHEEQRIEPPVAPSIGPHMDPPAAPGSSAPARAPLSPALSVIVPAHRCAGTIGEVLRAVRAAEPHPGGVEIIVVDDASGDGTPDVAAPLVDVLVRMEGAPRGPAHARNRGAAVARGELLAFVDSDVRVHPDALRLLARAVESDASAAAAFGAYDDAPPATGLVSRYRNLLHHHVHATSPGDAESFWAGLGVVRADAFHRAGGFDEERYPRPQIEDVELGYRLRDDGHRIVLRPDARGTHLKRWTLAGMIRTDVRDRGVPWTRLLLERRGRRGGTLNVRTGERVLTALMALALASVPVAVATRDARWLAAGAAMTCVVIAANLPLLAWFARARGPAFAIGVVPLRVLYYALNALSFAWGATLHLARRRRTSRERDPRLRPELTGQSATSGNRR
ncbi:MAG TPA: FAD-dependent oxidoreductase [Gemmatimonadales bacterium]